MRAVPEGHRPDLQEQLRAAYIVLQTRHVGHVGRLAERVLQQAQREVGGGGGPGAGVRGGRGELEVSGGSRRLEGVVQPVPQPEARLVQQATGRGGMDGRVGGTVASPAATLCCLQEAKPPSRALCSTLSWACVAAELLPTAPLTSNTLDHVAVRAELEWTRTNTGSG